MMSQILKTAVLSATVLTVIGCAKGGGGSNPIENYNIPTVKSHTDAPEQKDMGSPIVADLDGDKGVNSATFVDGQPGQANFHVRSTEANPISFGVQIQDGPEGLTINQSKADATLFVITWTPPMGYSKGNPHPVLKLRAIVTDSPNPMYKAGFVLNIRPITLTVNASEKAPIIKGVTNIKAGVKEDGTLPFTIDVVQPDGLEAGAPEVTFAPDFASQSSKENNARDISTMITIENFVQISSSRPVTWRYSCKFDPRDERFPVALDGRGKPDPKASSIPTAFTIHAKSNGSGRSTSMVVPSKVIYVAKAPTVVFGGGDAPTELELGQKSAITFVVARPDQRDSKLGQSVSFGGLPGIYSEVKCNSQEKNMEAITCRAGWYMACDTNASGEYTVTVTGSNTFNGTTRPKTVSAKYKIIRPENCGTAPVKAPAKKAVVAKAPAKPAEPTKAVVPKESSR